MCKRLWIVVTCNVPSLVCCTMFSLNHRTHLHAYSCYAGSNWCNSADRCLWLLFTMKYEDCAKFIIKRHSCYVQDSICPNGIIIE